MNTKRPSPDCVCVNCGSILDNIRWVVGANRECCCKECYDAVVNPVTADNDKPKSYDSGDN